MPSHYSYGDMGGVGGNTSSTNPFNFTNTTNKSEQSAGEDHKKPCRACVDFKTWRKQQAKSAVTTDTQNESNAHNSNNCPLDKDQLGQHTWGFLHTMAAYYPDKPSINQQKDMSRFFTLLSKLYPCEVCAKDLSEQLKERPPITSSQSSLSQWLCSLHNSVNQKLGKPIFDCSKVNERWRDGPPDGSCDY